MGKGGSKIFSYDEAEDIRRHTMSARIKALEDRGFIVIETASGEYRYFDPVEADMARKARTSFRSWPLASCRHAPLGQEYDYDGSFFDSHGDQGFTISRKFYHPDDDSKK